MVEQTIISDDWTKNWQTSIAVKITALMLWVIAVLTAVNAQEGVDLAQSQRPDQILMDLSLPVMDGWEATRRIRANAHTAAIPVIALTAHALPADHAAAITLAATTWIPSLWIWSGWSVRSKPC